ncbi:MAG TPA: protein kinase [Gemmatimonadales bacterium]|nr:protein kinase [Gemmatimonadales bacterium]HRZ09094.1 protein kinase [Gemmatimonadales bacterium]
MTRLSAALADKYRIERELGAGGMATVYLAQDLKHDRKVALKVLRPELAAVIGAERFLSEIKTTANLQHPHILPLFDSGEADSFLFYVMPYVEGETVRDRISREKQLPVTDAVRITSEVAAALDYAHRHGVIHRDIKPENILLHDGSALVADFGIALAASKAGGTRMTETGMSLGTPHYMSPEQAMGDREISARSDVYALGCVAYEMLVGEPPFTGPTAQAIIARVMTEEPRTLTLQRKTIPPGVEAAVFTALEKLPADRFATAAEFAAALANPSTTTARTSMQPVAVHQRRRSWLVAGVVGAAALLAGVLIGGRKESAGSIGPGEVVRASIGLGDTTTLRAINNLRLAMSADGRRIVFVGSRGPMESLWLRELDQETSRPLPGTDGAFSPFFSPDGSSVGFFTSTGSKGTLKVVSVAGGTTRVLVQDSVAFFGGGSWGDDGNVYFTHDRRGLARVPAAGGEVTLISRPDSAAGIQEHDFPDVLPGSRHALVMLWKGGLGNNTVGVVDLRSGAVTELMAASMARYVAPGFIAAGDGKGQLLAVRFDPRKAKLLGSPAIVLQDLQEETQNGTAAFAVSATGTIVYQTTAGDDGLQWVARDGGVTPVDTSIHGTFGAVALSPDGSQIAVSRMDEGSQQIWVKQLSTGSFTRLPFEATGSADRPVWAPDGRSVGFIATRDNVRTAWIRRADGSDGARVAVPGDIRADEVFFDPLGRYTLLRSEGSGPGTRYLLMAGPGADSVPRPLLQSTYDHYGMVLSPDGRWLAYVSEESGRPEVYVRPFPNVDSARIAVSVGGANEPLWRADGRELFFRDRQGGVWAVPVTTGAGFSHGAPTRLFIASGMSQQGYHRAYAVHPDGRRFLMIASSGRDAPSLRAIFNWRVELERLEQVAK